MVRIVIQRTSRDEPSPATCPLPPPPEDNADAPQPPRPRQAPFRRTPARLLARFVPRWLRWTALVVVLGLIFRRAVAWVVLAALGGALHLIGINAHLPSVRFGWPWQSVTSGTTTSTLVGPWVLQKIEGISRPALGTENFNFLYTHKVSKNIGPWPCWYSSTFYAVGHASATVDLNPGPSWWKPSAGHYQLRVLRAPDGGRGGRVSVAMTLPAPQLPRSAHDVTIDNTLSAPVSASHSWTYPGLGCGSLLKPQFAQSVVYAGAQQEAFNRVRNVSSVTRPLISAAESEATTMVRDNFIQPTLNALGYTLTAFTIRWIPAP
ncbi:MAG: hypothetical protein J2P26_09690 [Nocardiopsaceae bacterium]|nr:hypothetical protein [Nocardiopsaceae bacterium]